MKISKVNAEISISRNYNKVTLGISDEPVDYETTEDLKVKVREIFELLRNEVEQEFSKILQ